MNSLCFVKSSKKAWNLLHRLNGKSKTNVKIAPITPDKIATQLINNSKGSVSADQKKNVIRNYSINLRNSPATPTFARSFSVSEITDATTKIESGKAPGLDNIFPDFLKHLGPLAQNWMAKLFTRIHQSGRIPRE